MNIKKRVLWDYNRFKGKINKYLTKLVGYNILKG